jgi:hypothetical protein
MLEKEETIEKPAPERLAALRALPREIVQSLTRRELPAFLNEDIWPDSLGEKLKDYVLEE